MSTGSLPLNSLSDNTQNYLSLDAGTHPGDGWERVGVKDIDIE